jgi:Spy/CpxP family protein refolding chaperone
MRLPFKEHVMKYSKLIFTALMSVFTLPGFAADADNNPPGPTGGPGTNWENRPGMQGGPGMSPDRHPRLSAEQREKLRAMSPEDRKAFAKKMREERAQMRGDRDNNPPGAAGGVGTNWENRPGPQGGPGSSPDRIPRPER